MDIEMPRMNGIEATEEIFNVIRNSYNLNESDNNFRPHTNTEDEDCFIVFQTANCALGSEEACINAGAKRVLTKPIKKDELEEVLNQYFFLE